MEVSIDNRNKNDDNHWARQLGKAPAKSEEKLLHLVNFMKATKEPPVKTNFWPKRSAFPRRSFGNLILGDCTRAKQAIAAMRMERIEVKQTPKITDEEVIRVYTDMENRLYGGGDNGAFEIDALNEWRRPETTFKDTKGRPLTIDAFISVDQRNLTAWKLAMATAGAHGLAVCFNLPLAWSSISSKFWDIPDGKRPIGIYLPGSWGGHSMWAIDYDEKGVYLESTWEEPVGLITWRAFAAYCDESYLVIDSLDSWRKKASAKNLNLKGIKEAVNDVSSFKIK